jgi:hypothetical protein
VLVGEPGQELTLRIVNRDVVVHAFTLEEQDIDEVLQPGAEPGEAGDPVEVKVTFPSDGGRLPSENVQRILPSLTNGPREMTFGRCYRLAADRGTVARGHQLVLGELGLGGRFASGLRHVLVHPSEYTAGMMEAGVLVFSDDEAAREAHRLLLPGIVGPAEELDEALEPVREIPAEGLGEESFGLRGSILVPGVDGVLFAWQRSDLVLWVLGAREMGRPDTAPVDEMLEVDRSMDARAE